MAPSPFPDDKAERISVNSYGIGGSNAHVTFRRLSKIQSLRLTCVQFIIDSAASFGLDTPHLHVKSITKQQVRRTSLLLFSANHAESLKRVGENIEAYLDVHPDRLEDLAYTLAKRREHLKLRTHCVFKDDDTPFEVSTQTRFQGVREAAFVFTGQGAQW